MLLTAWRARAWKLFESVNGCNNIGTRIDTGVLRENHVIGLMLPLRFPHDPYGAMDGRLMEYGMAVFQLFKCSICIVSVYLSKSLNSVLYVKHLY